MTGNRPVINIPSPQALGPPPATVVMKNGHKVNTTGDQWQLFEVGTTYTLYFARFRDFCSPEFVNGLKWAYYKRLPKLSLNKAYTDLGTFFMMLKGFCEQKGVQINFLSESDMLNLRARNSERFLMVKGLLRAWLKTATTVLRKKQWQLSA